MGNNNENKDNKETNKMSLDEFNQKIEKFKIMNEAGMVTDKDKEEFVKKMLKEV